MFGKKKPNLPRPSCPGGGVHNDNGRQFTRGNKLYTCCSKCGTVVTTDTLPADDED